MRGKIVLSCKCHMIQDFMYFVSKSSQHKTKENISIFFSSEYILLNVFFRYICKWCHWTLLNRAMHKWDSAAAPFLLCADNTRFHACGSFYHFLSKSGGGKDTEDRRKHYFILLSSRLLRNAEGMVLTQFWKRNCCSAERKHDTQRTTWGEVGEGVQIWLLKMKNTVLLIWIHKQNKFYFEALKMWKISTPS